MLFKVGDKIFPTLESNEVYSSTNERNMDYGIVMKIVNSYKFNIKAYLKNGDVTNFCVSMEYFRNAKSRHFEI